MHRYMMVAVTLHFLDDGESLSSGTVDNKRGVDKDSDILYSRRCDDEDCRMMWWMLEWSRSIERKKRQMGIAIWIWTRG